MTNGAKSGFSKPSLGNPELGTAELLVKVADRDAEALASLYDQFAPSLMGILVRILSSKLDAESALEAVFLRLWKVAPEVAEPERERCCLVGAHGEAGGLGASSRQTGRGGYIGHESGSAGSKKGGEGGGQERGFDNGSAKVKGTVTLRARMA